MASTFPNLKIYNDENTDEFEISKAIATKFTIPLGQTGSIGADLSSRPFWNVQGSLGLLGAYTAQETVIFNFPNALKSVSIYMKNTGTDVGLITFDIYDQTGTIIIPGTRSPSSLHFTPTIYFGTVTYNFTQLLPPNTPFTIRFNQTTLATGDEWLMVGYATTG